MNEISVASIVGSFTVAQLSAANKEDVTPWLTIIAVALSAIALLLVIRASRHAMRRCVLCRGVSRRLGAMRPMKASTVLRSLAAYEGSDRRPRNVMICEACQTVYDCTPRDYAIVGATRLEKDAAIAAGVKLQVGDFGCHRCGETLVESDSPSVTFEDMEIIDNAVAQSGCKEFRMRLFCKECNLPHLWVPLADTGYRFLKAINNPSAGQQSVAG